MTAMHKFSTWEVTLEQVKDAEKDITDILLGKAHITEVSCSKQLPCASVITIH